MKNSLAQTESATQRTGPDALLTEDTAVWKVGINDARKCTTYRGSCNTAKYYDYMFVGNVILFCPGRSLVDAQENCEGLLVQMQ